MAWGMGKVSPKRLLTILAKSCVSSIFCVWSSPTGTCVALTTPTWPSPPNQLTYKPKYPQLVTQDTHTTPTGRLSNSPIFPYTSVGALILKKRVKLSGAPSPSYLAIVQMQPKHHVKWVWAGTILCWNKITLEGSTPHASRVAVISIMLSLKVLGSWGNVIECKSTTLKIMSSWLSWSFTHWETAPK
mgnify:CR=1 FL=1